MNTVILGQTKEIYIDNYIEPLPLPLLLSLPMLPSKIEQPKETFNGNYLVTKIHVTNDYYLIFLKEKNGKIYTIYSKKELIEKIIHGQKIHKDSTYFFELTYVPPKYNIVSSLEIINSYGFIQFEIAYLCSAKNLIGLTIITIDNSNKAKNKRKK